jgi:Phage tail tube protein
MSGTYGVTTKFGLDTNNPVTKRFNFLSDGVVLAEEHVQTAGNVGSRSEPSERVRTGLRRVGGPVVFQPNPVELNNLLQFIMGGAPLVGTPAGKTTFPLADTIPTFFVTSDRGSKVFTYDTCAVDKATFRSTQGGPLSLTLDIVGKDETPGNAGTFPAINIDLTQQCFMHQDLVLTVNAVAHKCPDWELTIDNAIDKDRFFNSPTLTSVQATARLITLVTRLPYGDSSAAYNLASAGVSADATFTNGLLSLDFVLPALQVPRQSPPIEGRNEVFLPIAAVARKVGSTPGTTDELSIILDLT